MSRCPVMLRIALAAISAGCALNALGDGGLVVVGPEVTTTPSKNYRLLVEDGVARVRLKWAVPRDRAQRVEFSLSPFKATGQPVAAIGFARSQKASGSSFARLRDVEVSPEGVELQLTAAALAPDVDYVGALSAAGDGLSSTSWGLTLVRSAVASAFRCPAGAQVVTSDGSTVVELEPAFPLTDKTVDLRLSAFVSKDSELGDVGFAAGAPGGPLRRELTGLPVDGGRLVPPIRAFLSEGATYAGRLSVMAGDREVAQCALELQLPKVPRGELMIDSQVLTRTVTLPMFRDVTRPQAELAVRLFEKSRARSVHGLTALLDGATESPAGTFDLARHVSFYLDGKPVPDFTHLRLVSAEGAAPSRSLGRGDQVEVGLKLRDLRPGKYAFGLRFAAADAAGVAPKLDLVINVRHHWGWAVVAVAVALALSFLVTKGITNWRERLRIRSRVKQLKTERFDEHGFLPSTVFLRAVLAQTERLLRSGMLRRVLLAPPPSVYDYLGRAERVVTILRRYAALHRMVDAVACPEFAKHRYRECIAEVLQRIGPQPLDQKTTDEILQELGTIAARLSDPMAWYWSDLAIKGKVLAEEARRIQEQLGDAEFVGGLLAILEAQPPALTKAYDDAYWLVKLLCSRRGLPDEEIGEIIAAYRNRNDLTDAFEVGDRRAWGRLQRAVAEQRIRVAFVDGAEVLESLRPCKLVLEFDDPRLAESYLVLNVLTYEWHFKLTPQAPRLFSRTPPPPALWSVTVNGPRVTQYAPFAGDLEVSVDIRWDTATHRTSEAPLLIHSTVHDNTELSLRNGLDESELALMALVAGVTLATSLPGLYFSKPTFGSFADYVAILAWAVGIDQGKNLIQALKAFPADSTTPATS